MKCIRCQTPFDGVEGSCPKCGWDPSDKLDAMAGFRPGELVNDRYTINESLGVGRFGTVLRALDRELGIEVALKVIHPSLLPATQMQDKFMAWVRSLFKLKHENMAGLFDVGIDGDERCFISRQLVGGVPLSRLMENRRVRGYVFPIDEVLPIIEILAQFLGGSRRVVHGALCPEKIWILPDHLKVTDTAIALCLPQAAVWYCLRDQGRSSGYVAPEIGQGQPISMRADVFSMGALIGEMLTQKTFDGRAEIFRHSNPNLTPGIITVLEKALSLNPGDRYDTPQDLLKALGDEAAKSPMGQSLPVNEGRLDYSFLEEDDSALTLSPKYSKSSDTSEHMGDTAQVLMEEVIRSHEENFEPQKEGHATKVRPDRPTDLAGLARIPKTTQRPARVSGQPEEKPARPPVPKRDAAAPHVPHASAQSKSPIEPKRPIPFTRDTRPPSYVTPPSLSRADDPIEKPDDTTSRPSGRKKKHASTGGNVSDKTEEIDVSDLAQADDSGDRRDVTQEIDLEMIEAAEHQSTGKAAHKLDKVTVEAERDSAKELLRRAPRLEGVDPRLVRAAHKLESEKRGDKSKQAAQILRERAEQLDGIDPRLLRAAARLEEARVKDSSKAKEENAEKKAREKKENTGLPEDDDWRERLSKTNSDSVISFLAPTTGPRTADVRGFPKTQNRNGHLKSDKRTPVPPPPAPPPRRR